MRTTWNLSGNKIKITFLLTLYFIFLCSIDTVSKEFHNGGICGGDCMVVQQFDKFEEKNPDIFTTTFLLLPIDRDKRLSMRRDDSLWQW